MTFQLEGTGRARRVECADGESIFDVARGAGIFVPTSCVGKASCGLCRVKILAGEGALSPFNAAERKHLGNVYFINKLRLACQTRVSGDVMVELPAPPGDDGGPDDG